MQFYNVKLKQNTLAPCTQANKGKHKIQGSHRPARADPRLLGYDTP